LVSKTIKSFIYMGCGVNKLIFGITGTEEPVFSSYRNLRYGKIFFRY
jgi:hypothetical protein